MIPTTYFHHMFLKANPVYKDYINETFSSQRAPPPACVGLARVSTDAHVAQCCRDFTLIPAVIKLSASGHAAVCLLHAALTLR